MFFPSTVSHKNPSFLNKVHKVMLTIVKLFINGFEPYLSYAHTF